MYNIYRIKLTKYFKKMNDEKIKVLFIDIETSPNLAYVWGKWEQNVLAYEKEWDIIAFSAKWLQGKHTTKILPDYKGYKKENTSDIEIVKELWYFLNDADVIIGHNAKSFDIKKINTKFLQHGLNPPEPYEVIDTLKIARKYFNFNSNKLNDLAQSLNIGEKVKHTGFDLWLQCIQGSMKHWKLMKKYNRQDVVLLEKVYLKMLPWIDNHPNVSIFNDISEGCRNCSSSDLQRRGKKITRTGKKWRYVCRNCGTWMTGKFYKVTTIG